MTTIQRRESQPDLEQTPTRPLPSSSSDASPPAEELSSFRLGAHCAGLVPAAMIGTLIRLGLDALADYDGRIVFPLAWAQGVGCGIMGLALGRKNEIMWIYPPLYTFLTTGIAGSVTTFSSWMLEGFESFSNSGNYSRGGLYDTVDGLGYSFVTFAISIACLLLGKHMAQVLPRLPRLRIRPHHTTSKESSSSNHAARTPVSDSAMFLSAAISYAIALVLYFAAPRAWRHRAVFPLLLAPPGAILRYALSKLNTRAGFLDRFPVGTFIANIVATLIICGVYAAQRRPAVGTMRCDALYALQQGFCGCLSTVSTFAVEATTIRGKRWTWIYVLGSVVFGHILALAVVGGVRWNLGLGVMCRGSDV